MTQSQQFKHDHPSLLNKYDIEGMISLVLSHNGAKWSDEGSYIITFEDGSTYNSHIISDYFVDRV